MPAVLAPWLQQKFTDNNDNPLSGGKVFTYIAGTNTPIATYTDESGTVPNTNPIILNAAGVAKIWLRSGHYKFVLKDANDNVIDTYERVAGYGTGGGGGGAGAVRAVNAGNWVAPPGTGAIKDFENGFEVFKFSFEAEQELTRVVTVPLDYAGGPIYMNIPFYSPATEDAVRFEVETTLANPGDAFSSEANQYSEQVAWALAIPSDKTFIKQFFLTPNGKINDVTVQPLAKLKVKLKRVSTNPAEEGADDIDDVRVVNDSEEVVYA